MLSQSLCQSRSQTGTLATVCVFLGYSADHKGYRCLDLTTNNIIVSRHIVFDEAYFPFSASPRLTNDLDIFLQDGSLDVAPMLAPLPVPHVSSHLVLRSKPDAPCMYTQDQVVIHTTRI
jgi:hypothetical protein